MNGHEIFPPRMSMEGQLAAAKDQTAQLDRIEAQNAEILALLKKKKRVSRGATAYQYPEVFEQIWRAYPKRAGGNGKQKAYHAMRGRSVGMSREEEAFYYANKVFNGVHRYAKFCDATGKTGTEFVMQAATFFGPDKHYENDWTIPKPKADPYAKPEIFSQSHQKADFSRDVENSLDTSTNPYGDM